MANSRIVNTNFWRDNYVMDLDPSEKLLFLYFLTNPNTTMAGVYEINLRTVAYETGFDLEMVKKILARFCADGKMWYKDGWLVLKNFIKHQRLNPSIQRGIERAIGELPDWLQKEVKTIRVDGQLHLELPQNTQSDDSLGTDTPQKKLIEAKLSKPNGTAARGSKIIDEKLTTKEREAKHRASDRTVTSVREQLEKKGIFKRKAAA